MQKQTAFKRMNIIVSCIRNHCKEHPDVSFAKVCIECEISPSSLYQYIPLIIDQFPDIKYEAHSFSVTGFQA